MQPKSSTSRMEATGRCIHLMRQLCEESFVLTGISRIRVIHCMGLNWLMEQCKEELHSSGNDLVIINVLRPCHLIARTYVLAHKQRSLLPSTTVVDMPSAP